MSETKKPQCHFISNTHWDREWRYSMQRTRYMLVYMLDMLFDILEKEPEFHSFHMDSQTIPLQDYLEIRPERREQVVQYVKEGRLLVGPWFVLPDEFCVGGESLVRNLLLGHRQAKELGSVSKTGYSPFGWGQISQMPQIYKGFGIPFASFYRGVNTDVAPNSEFRWQSPDGTEIVGSRLAKRPRYNVWYIVQRPAYFNREDENARLAHWDSGSGPFRLADGEFNEIDMRYARPEFNYYEENIPARALQALREQDDEWTTEHRFWSCGHDSSCPDIREVRMIKDLSKALESKADVFHSTFTDFQRGVIESITDDLPQITGEMRYYYTEGSSSVLFGWITSARMDIKKINYCTERLLGSYAETMASFASLAGAAYPRGFLDHAWNLLMQNHGHDSIGGCSRDIVPQDMLYRYRQVNEISICVMEQAFADIAGAIDMSGRDKGEVAVVAWNALPQSRTEIAELVIDIPKDLAAEDFRLVDADGVEVPFQSLESSDRYTVIQNPNDCANMMAMKRQRFFAELPGIPGLGYKTFFVKPLDEKKRTLTRTIVGKTNGMENEFLSVVIQSNGALSVTDKLSGRSWTDLGYFRDCSEIGNPWEHVSVPYDEVLNTLGENARIARVLSGELVTTYKVELDWELPHGRNPDEKHRSSDWVLYRIVNMVTLRKGQPWVEIETTIVNNAEDHYLQVSFPTYVESKITIASSPFDVVERRIKLPDPGKYHEALQTEHPMDRFVAIEDGKAGVALLNEGLKAYEPHDDDDQTLSLTMLRCFPLRICITNLEMTDYSNQDNGSQCLGTHTFKYAFMPYSGTVETARIWQFAERFNHALRVAQIGPSTDGGKLPMAYSFLEVENDALHVSAVKQSENGEGWVVRLFNPTNSTLSCKVRLNGGKVPPDALSPVERQAADFALPADTGKTWSKARLVNLEELETKALTIEAGGTVSLDITKKKIVTIEFLP
jgi:mannosylglycerate hydrolase